MLFLNPTVQKKFLDINIKDAFDYLSHSILSLTWMFIFVIEEFL